MSEAFLKAAGWSDALRKPLAGDASGRRYERLVRGNETAILMIAPEGDAGGLRRFERISDHLRNLGLSAPEVLIASPDEGLMLLEDLGDRLYPASIAANPAHEPELYSRALDCLFILQSAPPPEGLTVFSSDEMAHQACLPFFTWAGADADAPCPYEDGLKAALDEVAPKAPALMLRDFHAENLFWLPERPGPSAVGLIDFQDARLSSPLYDIVSLLWDARRDVSYELRTSLLLRTAERLGRPLSDVRAEAATLSLQRNLRILGVFARLAANGRTGYLAYVPRVWRHIEDALSAHHLAALSRSIREVLPAPSEARFSSAHLSCVPTPAR